MQAVNRLLKKDRVLWTENMSLLVRTITYWQVREFEIYSHEIGNSSRATIVKEIAHIHFPFLTTLNLNNSRIESVEELSNIRMPSIRKLFVAYNRIISVKVIRKPAWPELETLSITNNPFTDAQSLTQGNFLKLKQLRLYSLGNKNEFIDYSFPSKIETPFLKQLCILCITVSRFSFYHSLRVFQQRWACYVRIK